MPKIAVMANVSRPLIALLIGTVAFFGVWVVALKPSSSTSSGGSSGVGAYQSAIDKAHQAVATSSAASGAHGGTVATSSTASGAHGGTVATTPASATASTPASTTASTPASTTGTGPVARAATAAKAVGQHPATPARVSPAATHRLNVVAGALRAKKVIALLFYNPAAADDRAVKQELAAVPIHGARVVKLAVPLSELARYTVVTDQVPVNGSPTLVLVNPASQATTIVGFADRFEVAQRIAYALTVR